MIFMPFQDSCNEANTPDHTAETGLVVTETPVHCDKADTDTSPVTGHQPPPGHNTGANVDMLADLFEKLFHLNKKLEEQEDDIFRYDISEIGIF